MAIVMTIRSRVYGGAGLLVALSLAISGFAIWQILGIQAETNKLAVISTQNVRLLTAAVTTETMRRQMNIYRLDSDVKRLEAAKSAREKAIQLTNEAIAETVSADRKVLYGQSLEALVKLGRDTESLAAITNQSLTEKAALFKGGDDLTAVTNKLAQAIRSAGNEALAGQLESAIYLVRIANWRFLATNNVQGPEVFKANLQKASTIIGGLEDGSIAGVDKRLFEPVKNALGNYAKAFEGAASALLKIERIFVDELRISFEVIEKAISLARESLDRDLERTQKSSEAAIGSTVFIAEFVAALALLVGAVVAFFVGRGIIKPIAGMTRAMTALAGGDTAIAVPSLEAKDEMGAMARAVEVFKVNGIEVARMRSEQEATEHQRAAERKADMMKLADDFEGAVGEIIQTVSSASTELEASANTLSSTAVRTEELSTRVAAAAEEASANVHSVASASEEMSSSVHEISRQVQESARIAGEAVAQAQRTNDRVHELSQAASKIGDVIDLINSIAGQTNLLALNATIEAARAGEAGRGFAVVASEVKSLAEQTAKATGEIADQIKGIQNATADSVDAIEAIGVTIGRISEISSTIASAVEEQGAATQEISRNVQQASQGTSQVAFNITDVQRGSSETGAASAQVLSSAQSLNRDSNRLKYEVEEFLATVRAR